MKTTSTAPNRKLDFALKLADTGAPVFPCREKDEIKIIKHRKRLLKAKTPLTPNGFRGATTDAATIESWWRRWPNALVGLVTGKASGLLVVDIDPKGAAWFEANAARMPAGLVQTTKKGRHLYFKHVPGIAISTNNPVSGVDIRAEGGYVIAWGCEGLPAVGSLEDVTPLPDWLRIALQPRTTPLAASKAPTPASVAGNGWKASERLIATLKTLDPDADYGRWVTVGMALHYDSRGAAEALQLYDEWSRTGKKYREGEPSTKWATFSADKAGGVTLGTVYAMAPDYPPPAPVAHEASQRGLRITWPGDADCIEPPPQLVQGLLVDGSLALLYGASNVGKSTLAVDIGLAIARGVPWAGRDVLQGLVLHIAGEGFRGVHQRIAAHCRAHEVDKASIPYAVVDGASDLLEGEQLGRLIAEIKGASEARGKSTRLIIVDTLARLFAADENDGSDMRAIVAACDALREATGACVLVVHHSGKSLELGARGHSSLRCAVDTELQVTGEVNPRTLAVRKQRDLPPGEPMGFDLRAVEIATDTNGQPVTACVVEPAGFVAIKVKASGANQKAALVALREWIRTNPEAVVIRSDDIRDLLQAQRIARQRRPDLLNWLVNARILTATIGGYTVDRGAL